MAAFDGIGVEDVLRRSLSILERNHRLIANNIANVDTPNFRPARTDFQKSLKRALAGKDAFTGRVPHRRHFVIERERLFMDRRSREMKNDYNEVDIDFEMAELAKNTGRHTVYGSLLSKRYDAMKYLLRTIR